MGLWGGKTEHFYHLGIHEVLNAIDRLGLSTTGRAYPLNSMENRVYAIEVDENNSEVFYVAKFYRPGRWSTEQIAEEHLFLTKLTEADVPVITPLTYNGETIFFDPKTKLSYSLYPMFGGRAPDEISIDQFKQIGRLSAKMHRVGKELTLKHRLTLSPKLYLEENFHILLKAKIIPNYLEASFKIILDDLLKEAEESFKTIKLQTIHGDLHRSNLIVRDEKIYLLDFDDMGTGPIIQDLWMLLPGNIHNSLLEFNAFLEGYETFFEFPHNQIKMVSNLRAMRVMNFCTWVALRYDDPSFKNAFPYFNHPSFWEEKLTELKSMITTRPSDEYY